MAAGANHHDGIFRYVYEGCIAGGDTGIQHRPYHRNCGCALHDKNRGKCRHDQLNKGKKISYPIRRAWSEGCLVLAAGSCNSSPSCSPSVEVAVDVGNRKCQMGSCNNGEDHDEGFVFFKV